MKCCFCGKAIFENESNNPKGAMWLDPETNEVVEFNPKPTDRCCNSCNSKYVIPGRLYKMNKNK